MYLKLAVSHCLLPSAQQIGNPHHLTSNKASRTRAVLTCTTTHVSAGSRSSAPSATLRGPPEREDPLPPPPPAADAAAAAASSNSLCLCVGDELDGGVSQSQLSGTLCENTVRWV